MDEAPTAGPFQTALDQADEATTRLLDVGAALGTAKTVDDVLDIVAGEMFTASNADGMLVSLVRGKRLELVRSRGYPPALIRSLQDLGRDESSPQGHVAAQLRPLFLSSPTAYLSAFPHLGRLVRLSEMNAWAILPLVASGRGLGAWQLSWNAERRFTDSQQALLVTLGGLCAQALERARLFQAQQAIATALQQALLPQQLPAAAGLGSAARYVAGGPSLQVGGDWYDVLPRPGRPTAIVIGDVAGHDIHAAAVMGGIRHAIRAYAMEGHGPAQVMELANQLLAADDEEPVTCCYLELDSDGGTATVVCAGHPAPLLLSRQGPPRQLPLRCSLPLGVDPAETFLESTVVLAPDDVLLLFTDGLIERGKRPLAEVLAAAGAVPSGNLETLLDAVLACLADGTATEDDVAVLAVAYRPVGGPRTPGRVRRRLDDEAQSAWQARRFVADVLGAWRLPDIADAALLAVSELVTNAIAHTVGQLELGLVREHDHLLIEVADSSDRLPAFGRAADDATSGRGMFIVDAVAAEWGVSPTSTGKTVWARLPLAQTCEVLLEQAEQDAARRPDMTITAPAPGASGRRQHR